MWLKVADSGAATRGSFFALDIDGGGADAYETAITTCDPAAPIFVFVGDVIPVLMGNLHGPTVQGVLNLISQDVDAYWDDNTRSVVSSKPASPRVVAIAAFNPAEFEESFSGQGPLQIRVANFLGVFVEGYINGYVIGVVTPIRGQ